MISLPPFVSPLSLIKNYEVRINRAYKHQNNVALSKLNALETLTSILHVEIYTGCFTTLGHNCRR
jgi:hypothetical protein